MYLFASCSALSSQQEYKAPAITAQEIPGINCTMYADSEASCCDWCCFLISRSLEIGTPSCARRLAPPTEGYSYQFLFNKLRTSATCSTVRLGSAVEEQQQHACSFHQLSMHSSNTILYYDCDDSPIACILCEMSL